MGGEGEEHAVEPSVCSIFDDGVLIIVGTGGVRRGGIYEHRVEGKERTGCSNPCAELNGN